jgi:ribose/xylose/arabinose/galactoside ABC-type transport system permease subunit
VRNDRRTHPALPAALGLAALCLFNACATPGFFRIEAREGGLYGAPLDVLKRGAQPATVAAAAAFVIATRGVDLSVGSTAALSGAVAATCVVGGGGATTAVFAALLAATLAGLFNGVLVALWRLPPIVATLVSMTAGRGAAQLVADGQIVTFESPALIALGSARPLGVPAPVFVAAGFFVLAAVAARRTALGAYVRALGDNPDAARAAGVPERALLLGVYAFSGLAAGVAGILAAADIKAADANHAGRDLELDAILAVVLGGGALAGGRFSLLGAAVGALLIQATTTTLYMHDVPPDVASAPKALVVLAVCALQSPVLRARFARRAP